MADIIPVGAVIAYASNAFQDIQFDGWLPCNGLSLNPADYPKLFAAIGTVHGGDGNQTFNLPNLQGLFVRGVDGGAGIDPDTSTRSPAAVGGQSGDHVGSLQAYATGLPMTGFRGSIQHLPQEERKGNYGSLIGDNYANRHSGDTEITVTGGDSETRPPNAYVNFIIKYTDQDDSSVQLIPSGAIIALAGVHLDVEGYLLCDGRQLSTNDRLYRSIYRAIGTAHGGNGLPYFRIPDYRGRFLRGVSNATGHDPDANTRTPMADHGDAGNNIGSIQGHATGSPINSFKASVPDIPNTDHKVDHIAGYNCAMWGDGATMNLASGGGDKESRPVNVYVDWYIKL